MTVTSFNANTYRADRNTQNLVSLKSRLDTLSTQLATGQASDSYGGLGSARTTSLSAHATLSALDGYDAAITAGTTRVALVSSSLTQLSTLSTTMKTGLATTTNLSAANSQELAANNLEAALDALNQSSAGQYLFGGRVTDTAPVASADTILNGNSAAGLAGVKTLIAEQKAADLGPNGNGRIATSAAGRTVTVTEEGTGTAGTQARANFGFRLVSASSSTTAITAGATVAATSPDVTFGLTSAPQDGDRIRVALNQAGGTQTFVDLTAKVGAGTTSDDTMPVFPNAAAAAAYLNTRFKGAAVASAQGDSKLGLTTNLGIGTPASVALTVNTTPKAGDTVTFNLALRDGTTQAITLTAATSAEAGSTSTFSLTGDVAANISSALSNALKGSAGTTLSASSASRATQDFFAGSTSAGLQARRIVTDANGNMSYATAASTKTVAWYTGDDTSADPRATAQVAVSANRSLDIGAQANEAPIRSVLAGMALMAAETVSTSSTDATASTRYNALVSRSGTLLATATATGGVQSMASSLSLASSNLTSTKSQNATTRLALQNALDGVDTVSTEAVAAQLLQLQTQLTASYQVTSMLSKLSLVNYLS